MLSLPAPSFLGPDFGSLQFPTFRRFGLSLHDHFIPHHRNNYHPHILSPRMLTLLSLLLMTVKIVSISLVAIAPALHVEASAISTNTIVSLANEARVSAGLNALAQNSLLTKAAQNKANDMLARQYFAHNTPTGETPWSFIKAVGYSYVTAGENLAIDFQEAESVQTAWMNSPGHRANILNKSFQEIGIGIAKGSYNGHETTIVVQMFGTPIAQQVTLPPEPTPVAQPAAAPAPQASPVPAPVPTPAPSEEPATPAPSVPEQSLEQKSVEIKTTETALQGGNLYLNVTASEDATKLLAVYGDRSILLDPAENNQWYAYIPVANINAFDNLLVYAYDIHGNLAHATVSQFTPAVNANPQEGVVEGASVDFFGKIVNAKVWEEKIILIVLAGLIACLILAIAIRRHVQHLSLIANTSFVAMLAAFMLLI
jgi:uncharacterized protein YkwD